MQQEIAPHAGQWDREEATPREIVDKLIERGWLGSMVPAEHGGKGLDMISYGVLTEEIGRGCSSIRSLLTVHDMVCRGILRWGSQRQKESWLPRLARGEVSAPSRSPSPRRADDAMSIRTRHVEVDAAMRSTAPRSGHLRPDRRSLPALRAKLDGKPTAFLVERETPASPVTALRGILGTRASMLAELKLEEPGRKTWWAARFGVSHVVGAALDRAATAWPAAR